MAQACLLKQLIRRLKPLQRKTAYFSGRLDECINGEKSKHFIKKGI